MASFHPIPAPFSDAASPRRPRRNVHPRPRRNLHVRPRRSIPALGLAVWIIALQALPFLASRAHAEFATPDCPVFSAADFTYAKLVTRTLDSALREPVKMAIDAPEGVPADIYFVERHGNVKRYNGAEKSITVLAHFRRVERFAGACR